MLWVTTTSVIDPPLPQSLELQVEALARERVERAERLVEQQHRRTPHERTCEAGLLRHPARQLGRERALEAAEADEVQGRARLRLARREERRSSRGNATFEIVSRHGSRRGSWKTSPTRSVRSVDRCPVSDDGASSGASRPAMTRSSVLLPDPFGPRIETSSPCPTTRSTACRATRRAPASGNARVTPRSSIAGVSTGEGVIVWLCRRSSNVLSLRPAVRAREERRTRAERSRSTHLERARGRRRRPSGRRLVPSPIRTFTPSAPCKGIPSRSVTGRGLATVPGTTTDHRSKFHQPRRRGSYPCCAPMIRRVASS